MGKPGKGAAEAEDAADPALAAVAAGGGAAGGDGSAGGISKDMGTDIKDLANYERMNKLAEQQRIRLKKLQQQELYNTRINKKLLLNIHRKFMRAEKVDSLRKEIEILAQNHEREVDRKDAIIQMLTKDLDDGEEQIQVAQRTHMEKCSKFIALNEQKLTALESEFERDLKTLKMEFHSEFHHIKSQHEREVKEMQAIIAAVDASQTERLFTAKTDHEAEREKIRNTNLEGINELKLNLEHKIEELEKQFDDAHQGYVDNTAKENKVFRDLQFDDGKLAGKILKRKRKIERLQEDLQYWKKKIEYNYKECEERNKEMKEQKDIIFKHCALLKAKMKRLRQSEAKRLTELSVLAREAYQCNQDKLDKADKILLLAELARKLETEREKVCPFYESALNNDDSQGQVGRLTADGGADVPESIDGIRMWTRELMGSENDWHHMDNFYKKYNKVLLDKLAIAQEKKRLQKENSDLRHILKQYLDGIAITEDAVDTDNPLLIVNGRVNLLDKGQLQRKPMPTVIVEANHTSAVQRMR